MSRTIKAKAKADPLTIQKNERVKLARYVMVLSTTMLLMLGLIMVFSASSVDALNLYGNPFHIFLEQLIWLLIGLILVALCLKLSNYKDLLQKSCPWLLIVGYLGLIAVLVPGIGQSSQGSTRWIGVSFIHVQPSELMKFVLIVLTSVSFSRLKKAPMSLKDGIMPVMACYALAVFLIMLQPDMGTSMVLISILTAMLIVIGTSWKLLAKLGLILLGGIFLLAVVAPYRRARLFSFWNPFSHPLGSGYQMVQSLVSLGSGHFFGDGLGASTAKWGFLPNDHTDFIFAVIGQELGLVGTVFILILFAGLIWAGFTIASALKDRFAHLLVVGLTVWLASQAVINVGAVIGLLPVTGIPLPFVSFGGSSLVLNLLSVGLILTASKDFKAMYKKPSGVKPAKVVSIGSFSTY